MSHWPLGECARDEAPVCGRVRGETRRSIGHWVSLFCSSRYCPDRQKLITRVCGNVRWILPLPRIAFQGQAHGETLPDRVWGIQVLDTFTRAPAARRRCAAHRMESSAIRLHVGHTCLQALTGTYRRVGQRRQARCMCIRSDIVPSGFCDTRSSRLQVNQNRHRARSSTSSCSPPDVDQPERHSMCAAVVMVALQPQRDTLIDNESTILVDSDRVASLLDHPLVDQEA
jgi:hypothetical protein